jgi:hypothetical protein
VYSLNAEMKITRMKASTRRAVLVVECVAFLSAWMIGRVGFSSSGVIEAGIGSLRLMG